MEEMQNTRWWTKFYGKHFPQQRIYIFYGTEKVEKKMTTTLYTKKYHQ